MWELINFILLCVWLVVYGCCLKKDLNDDKEFKNEIRKVLDKLNEKDDTDN